MACAAWLIIVSVLIAGPGVLPAVANLATNAGFETQNSGGTSDDAAGWTRYGQSYRKNWAWETGSWGMAFEGWWGNGGGGGFYQDVNTNLAVGINTNILYVFRIRQLVEANYADRNFFQKIEFLDNNWAMVGGDTNIVHSSSWGDNSWSTITMTNQVSSTGNAPTRVRIVWETTNATSLGGGGEAGKADRVMLWDKRASYFPGEIVDQFAYDPDFNNGIDGKDGGNGFSNAWNSVAATPTISDGSFSVPTNYPTPRGNKLYVDPGSGNGGAHRHFDTITTGTIYFAVMMNAGGLGGNQYAGVSFYDTTSTEKALVGAPGAENRLSVQKFGGSTSNNNSYTISTGAGNDHLIIGKYDFSTRKMQGKGVYVTGTVPLNEPTAWDAEYTMPAGYITRIDTLKLNCGGYSGGDPGDVFYDEFHVATNWGGLLNLTPTFVWDAGGGSSSRDWSETRNWEADSKPGASDNAHINGGYTGEVSQAGEKANTLYIGTNAHAVLEQSGGDLTLTADLYVGGNASTEGRYEMSGGSLDVGGKTYLADGSTLSTGILEITGGVATFSDYVYVGRDGEGLMVVSGTSTAELDGSTAHLYIGDSAGNDLNNRVQVDGSGFLDVGGRIEIGDGPRTWGSLVVSGGVVTAADEMRIGDDDEATGTVVVAGGIINMPSDDMLVGHSGVGTLLITSGAITNDEILVGADATADGTMWISGGVVNATGPEFTVGESGTGLLEIGGGTLKVGGDGSGSTPFYVGRNSGSDGTVIQRGGTVVFDDNSDLVIGENSGVSALYKISGGTLDFTSANGDAILIDYGTLHVIGDDWTIETDAFGDFTMSAGGSLTVEFDAGTIGEIIANDPVAVAGTLNVTNSNGDFVSGVYTVLTGQSLSGTFATTNWLSGTTGTVAYSATDVTITFAESKEINIQGTNDANIVDGDTTPTEADGTDYGDVVVDGGTKDHTFTIQNTGGGDLTVSGVTTSGSEAADFIVTDWPGIVSGGGNSNLVIRFNPSAVGTRTATIHVNSDDANEADYDFVVQGTGTWAGIGRSPTTLNVSSTLGSAPAASGFGVTNIGNGTLSYAISTNADWLTVSPVSGNLTAEAGQQHTVTFNVPTGTQPGTSNATITITDGSASNSPQTVSVEWTINAIPNPSGQSATADGNEMVRLAWTKDGSYDVMIVYRSGSAPTDPTQGTAYSVGDPCGGGTVLYKGSAAQLEHILAAGADAYYAFYSYNGNYYSSGVNDNTSLGTYDAGEIVEPFSYTNNVALGSLNGGNGWSGGWTVDGGTFTVVSNIIGGTPTFAEMANYPAAAGNRLKLSNPGNGNASGAHRDFSMVTTGSLYVAGKMCYSYDGANKWAGFSLRSNGTEKIFFGESGGADRALGMSDYGDATNAASYNLNPWSAGTSADTGNTYLVIAKYDFATRLFKVKAYYRTDAVPAEEPSGNWDVWDTLAANHMNGIDAIVVKAGESGGAGTVGDCYFDEIRMATTWNGLLNQTPMYATNYTIDTDNRVSDAQVTGGAFNVTMYLHHPSGIAITNDGGTWFEPNFDLWSAAGVQIVTDEVFSSFTFEDSGRRLVASDASHAGAASADTVLGTYTSRWSAIASNGVVAIDKTTLSNGTEMTFTVYDDDTNAPLWGVAGENLLTNPGFETNAAGWTHWGIHASYNGDAAQRGSQGIALTNLASASDAWNQYVDTTPGDTLTITVRGKKVGTYDPTVSYVKFEFWNGTKQSEVETNIVNDLTTDWQTFHFTQTVPAGIASNRILIGIWDDGTASGDGYAAFDNATLTEGDGAPLSVVVGSTPISASNPSTNGIFEITDATLTNISAANPLRLRFGGFDLESGLSRGTTDNSTQMNIDIGSWQTDNVAQWDSTESSSFADSSTEGATSSWKFTSVAWADVGGTNTIAATLFDADNDRTSDRLSLINQQYGYLAVVDDDPEPPRYGSILRNAGFEVSPASGDTTPDYWEWNHPSGWQHGGRWGNIGVETWAAYRGTNGASIRNWGGGALDGGWWQDVSNAAPDGVEWTMGVWAYQESGWTAAANYIEIEFRDINTNLIDSGNADVAQNVSLTADTWGYVSVTATSPPNAVWIRAIIGANGQSTANSFRFDEVHLAPNPPVSVRIGSTNYAGSTYGTNAVYEVTDADLSHISAASPLRLTFNGYDEYTGLSRNSNDPATQMNVDIGSWVADNVTNYTSAESSSFADSILNNATSTWLFDSIDAAAIATLYGTRGLTNAITVSVMDADDDRTGDRGILTNAQYGFLGVGDDDIDPPHAGNYIRNPDFDRAGSANTSAFYWESGYPDARGDMWGAASREHWRGYPDGSDTNEGAIRGTWSGAGDQGGFWQEVTNTYAVGTVWEGGAWFWNDGAGNQWTSATRSIHITFYNGSGTAIAGHTNSFTRPDETWTWYSVQATSVAGAAWARLTIQANGIGANGALQFDDVFMAPRAPVEIYIGSSNVASSAGSIGPYAEYVVNDGVLASVDGGSPFRMSFHGFDTLSGIQRGTDNVATQMNVDIGTWMVNNITNYVSSESTAYANTFERDATSVWRWVNMDANAIQSLYAAGTNAITVSIFDADSDRTDDQKVASNRPFGYLVVGDDDTTAPVVDPPITNNHLRNPSFEISRAGGTVDGTWHWYETFPDRHGGSWGNRGIQTWGPPPGGGSNQAAIINWASDAPSAGYWQEVPNVWGDNAVWQGGGMFYSDAGWTAGSTRIVIEFYDGSGRYGGHLLGAWTNDFAAPGPSWTEISCTATAPVGATWTLFSFIVDGGIDHVGAISFDKMFLYGSPPSNVYMGVKVGDKNFSAQYMNGTAQSTNAIFNLTDGDLADVSATSPLRFSFNAYDADSGLSRGTTDSGTQMNIDIGSWLTDNVTNYYAAESTDFAGSDTIGASSVWRWANALDSATISSLMTTSKITVSIFDADDDRTDDRLVLTNYQYGFLAVTDDDEQAPDVYRFDIPQGVSNTTLQAGEIVVVGFNSDDPDDVALLPMVSLPAGTQFDIDDDGSVGDGYVTYTAPAGGVDAGTVIIIESLNSSPSVVQGGGSAVENGSFSLINGAEGILIQQGSSNIFYLRRDGATTYTGLSTANNTIIDVTDNDNGVYIGTRYGVPTNILAKIATGANWDYGDGVGDQSFNLFTQPYMDEFQVSGGRLMLTLTDQYIDDGSWSFTGRIWDVGSGIDADGSAGSDPYPPHFDLYVSDGGNPAAFDNMSFTVTPADGGAKSSDEALAEGTMPGIGEADVELGIYTSIIYAADNDNDRNSDRLGRTAKFTFEVIDDDTDYPLIRSNAASRPMAVAIGDTYYTPSPDVDTTNAIFYIGYQALTNVSADNPFRIVISAFDGTSGLSRGTTDSNTQCNLDFGPFVNDVVHYEATNSSVDSSTATATNMWVWYNFTDTQVETITNNVTNAVTLSLFDNDYDRTGDRLSIVDHLFGYIVVTGSAPVCTSTNWAYDGFNYTVGEILDNKSGGGSFGWNGGWQNTDFGFTNDSGSFADMSGFPENTGNKIKADPPADTEKGALRTLDIPITNGRIYVSFFLNYEFGGDNKWAGVELMNGGTAQAFFGEMGGTNDQDLGIDGYGSSVNAGYGLNAGAGNDYLIIGCYDFATRNIRTIAYYKTDTVPLEEPLVDGGWKTNVTVGIGQITKIDGIKIKVGGSGVGVTPGQTYFDEIRVARSWRELIEECYEPPSTTAGSFDAGTDELLSDADMTTGVYNISLTVSDGDGLNTTSNNAPNFTPFFDIINAGGTALLTNSAWDTMTYADSGTTLYLTDSTHAVQGSPDIDFGTYAIRWGVQDSNGHYALHYSWMADGSNTTFTVYDDDSNGPSPALVYVGTNYTAGSVSSNVVTDGDLLNASLDVAYSWSDPSGLFVSNQNASATNYISGLGNVHMNWDMFDPNSVTMGWDVIHSPDEVDAAGGNGAPGVTAFVQNISFFTFENNQTGTWTLTVSAQDVDGDRGYRILTNAANFGGNVNTVSWDRAITTNAQMQFTVIDDDTNVPVQTTSLHLSPIVIGVDNYYASMIDDYFGGVSLKRQWEWESEPGTEGMVSDGLFIYATNANSQSGVGSIHDFVWNGTVAHTYQMTIESMFTNDLYHAGMYIGGDDAQLQPEAFSHFNWPNILYMQVRDFDETAGRDWGVKLYLKSDNPWATPYDPAEADLVGAIYSVSATDIDDSTFGFTLDGTNVTLYATNTAWSFEHVTNITAAQLANFSTQAHVHVYGRNDNVAPVGGDELKISRVLVLPQTFATNTVYTLYDGDLDYVSVTDPFKMMFPAYDADSGLSRGTDDPSTQMNVTVANFVTNDVANYIAAQSTVDSTLSSATSVWNWTSVSITNIQSLMNPASNRISADLFDADFDRSNDWRSVLDQQFGFLRVIDDDQSGPLLGHQTSVVLQVSIGDNSAEVASGSGHDIVYTIYDGDLAQASVSNIHFKLKAFDPSGMNRGTDTAATNMSVTVDGLADRNVTNFNLGDSTVDTTTRESTSVWTWVSDFGFSQVGTLYADGNSNRPVRGFMVDADDDRTDDEAWSSNKVFGYIRVEDDDNSMPYRSDVVNVTRMYTNEVEHTADSGTGTNRLFIITDGMLRDLSDYPMAIHFHTRDADSGIARGTSDASTNMNVSVDGWITNNVANYDASRSSSLADTFTENSASSVWRWASSYNYSEVSDLYGASGWSNMIICDVPDADFDRVGDQRWRNDQRYGILVLVDDDTNVPVIGTAVASGPMVVRGGTNTYDGNDNTTNALYEVPDGVIAAAGWSSNFLTNPGFETGDNTGWTSWGHTGVYNWAGQTGTYGFVFRDWNAGDTPPHWGGLYQDVESGVTGGTPYVFIMSMNRETNWTGTNVQMKVEFLDNAWSIIAASTNEVIDALTNSWQPFMLQGVAPDGATKARATVVFSGGTNTGGGGTSLMLDDAFFSTVQNPFRIVLSAYDEDSGLSRPGNLAPSRVMHVSIGDVVQTNQQGFVASESSSLAGTRNASASNVWMWPKFTPAEIQSLIDAGSNEIVVTLYDADEDRSNDRLSLTQQRYGWLRVTDDDNSVPTNAGMNVMIGGRTMSVSSGSGTGVVYRVTDGDLASVEGTNPLHVIFNVWDDSGINRGRNSAATNMNVSVEGIDTNNVLNFNPATTSSVETLTSSSTSVWTWLSFTTQHIAELYGTTGDSHLVTADIPDADADRTDDNLWQSNQQFGFIWVPDDDTNMPAVGGMSPNNLLYNPSFEQSGSWTGAAYHWDHNAPDNHGGTAGNYLRVGSNTGWRSHSGEFEASIPAKWDIHTNTHGGWWQEVTNNLPAGTLWEASGWFWSDDTGPKVWTAGWAGIEVEFWDETRTNKITHAALGFSEPGETWTKQTVVGTSPVDCAWVRIWINAYDMGEGDLGALQIDDVSLRPLETNTAMDFAIGKRSFYSEGTGTAVTFRVTDGDLASVSDSNLMKFTFALYDPTSGLYRTTQPNSTGMNYDVGFIWQNVQNSYSSSWSSADTTVSDATSVFAHAEGFSGSHNDDPTTFGIETGTIKQLMDAVNTTITLSAPDFDRDRGWIDESWRIDSIVGTLNVTDDDSSGPIAGMDYIGTNYTMGATSDTVVTDAEMIQGIDFAVSWWDYSGLFLTNTDLSVTNVDSAFGNVNPNWDFVNPDGTELASESIFYPSNLVSQYGNGSIGVTAIQYNVQEVNYGNNTVGTWRLQVSAQDADDDRGWSYITNQSAIVNTVAWDRTVAFNQWLEFTVIDDDSNAPVVDTVVNSEFLGVTIGSTNYAPIDGDGTTNALFRVYDGDLANVGGANVLDNSGFENGWLHYSHWGSNALAGTSADSGTNGVVFEGATNSAGGFFQNQLATTGAIYQVSVRARKEANFNAEVHLKIEFTTNAASATFAQYYVDIGPSLTTNWATHVFTAPVASTSTYVRATLIIPDANSDPTGSSDFDLHVDNFMLYEDVNPFRFVFGAYDADSGLLRGTDDPATQMNMSYSSLVISNVVNYYASESSADSTAASATSIWRWISFNPAEITEWYEAGTNAVLASVYDADNDRVSDRMARDSQQYGLFRVEDDDTTAPTTQNVSYVYIGGTNITPIPGTVGVTGRTFEISEGHLANLDTSPLEIHLKPYDADSGIARGTNDHRTNMHITIERFTTNDVEHFYAASSSTDAETKAAPTSSNVWRWSTPYDYAELGALFGSGGWTNPIMANVPDADQDRTDDTLWLSNQQFGFIKLVDDDVTAPAPWGVGSKFMRMFNTNEVNGSGSGTNTLYTRNDGQLRAIDGDSYLEFMFQVGDASGFGRDTANANTNMNITITNLAVNNVANYFAARSSASTIGANVTSVWRWSSAFTYDEVGDMWGVTSPILVTVHNDMDDDRANDTLGGFTNRQFGMWAITDDDKPGPVIRRNSTGLDWTNRAPLEIWLNGDTNYGYQGTNIWVPIDIAGGHIDTASSLDPSTQRYVTTDGALAGASNIMWEAWFSDSGSGISMSQADATTNTSLSIGTAIVNNVVNYDPTLSVEQVDEGGRSYLPQYSSNVWVWESYTRKNIGDFYGAAGSSNQIVLNAYDADTDRPGDQGTTNASLGWLIVNDDDVNAPKMGSILNLLRNPSFEEEATNSGTSYHWTWDTPDQMGAFWGSTYRTNDRSHTDQYAAQIRDATAGTWAEGGIWQQVTNDFGDGTVWQASGWFWAEASWTTTVQHLKIEWVDSGNSVMATHFHSFDPPDETWTWVSTVATAPANAAYVRWVVASTGVSDNGYLLIDDAALGPANGSPFAMRINGGTLTGATPNTVFDVTDEQLASISSTNPWRMLFSAFDEEGRLSRGNESAATQTFLTVENWITNNVTNFVIGAGSRTIDTGYTNAVSAWEWTSMDSATLNQLIQAGTNPIYATIFDDDDDRDGDRMTTSDVQLGYLYAHDDDTNILATDINVNYGSQLTDADIRFGTWILRMSFQDYSGFWTNSGATWLPNYSMMNPNGDTVHVTTAWTFMTNDYFGSTNWWSQHTMAGVDYEDVQTGTYQIVWSAQDTDNDRAGDRMAITNSSLIQNNSNTFNVIDDDTLAPTAPSNVVVAVSAWTNVNNFPVSWDPASDASGIGEYRFSTSGVMPSAIGDGTVLSDQAVTNTFSAIISNASFETGSDELLVPGDPAQTNHWTSYSVAGARGHFDDADAQDGSLSMRLTVDAGIAAQDRYALIAQDVRLNNTNDYKILIDYSGWFKGDLSGGSGAGTAFLKIEIFDAATTRLQTVENEWNTDHNGQPLSGVNASAWSNVAITVTNGPANAEIVRFVVGLSHHGTGLAYTGHWDNLSATIQGVSVSGTIFTNAAEGSNTVWLFAVDDDNDRQNDGRMGPVTNFVVRYDATAPWTVTNVTSAAGPDDTSEVELNWNAVPDGGGNNLSPWYSYQVYYREGNTLDPTTNDPFISVTNGPSVLGTNITGSAVLSNFVWGTTYRMAIAGVDRAGNIGPMSTSVVVTFSGFYVTQGVRTVSATASELSWTAATNQSGFITRAYDVLYVDAMDFDHSLSNQWELLATVTNSMVEDSGGGSRPSPTALTDEMRFYRAAQQGVWVEGRNPRVASREVYVLRNIRLEPGQNWVGLPFVPDTNTIAFVLGTNQLPAASSQSLSTRVLWLASDGTYTTTNEVWLSDTTGWRQNYPTTGDANDMPLPINEGFVIEIPTNESTQYVLSIGALPTNSFGLALEANAYNMISCRLPRRMHPAQMNLLSSGWRSAPDLWTAFDNADQMWKFDRERQALPGGGHIIYHDSTLNDWYFLTGNKVPTNYFGPDDAIVVYRPGASSTMSWSRDPTYDPPTRNINP